MRTRGIKLLDPIFGRQVDWLVVSAEECRNQEDESRLICQHFRKPHDSWLPNRAFVAPVSVRRSRWRVLFSQCSGLE